MDINLWGIYIPAVVQVAAQFPISWLQGIYAEEIRQFPQFAAILPFWGIAVGTSAGSLVQGVIQPWLTSTPGWAEVSALSWEGAQIGLLLTAMLGPIGFVATFYAVGIRSWKIFFLATGSLALVLPTSMLIAPILFRLLIAGNFYPAEMFPVLWGFGLTLTLNFCLLQGLRRGLQAGWITPNLPPSGE